MKLRPQNYFEFGNFLLAKKSFRSYTAMLAAAMKICNGFMDAPSLWVQLSGSQ